MLVISTYVNGNAQLHLVDLLSIYYTTKFATNPQQIVLMELKPWCIASRFKVSTVTGVRNAGLLLTALLILVNGMP